MARTKEECAEAAARVMADGPLPLRELAKELPSERDGRHGVRAATLTRWITKGRRGVHLDGAMLAGRGWYSSRAALARFAQALSAAGCGEVVTPAVPTERERRVREATAEMARLRGG